MAKFGIKPNVTSPLFDFPLGQCLVYFNGFLLGKTTSDTILKVDRDIKDIMFSQDGTKASDWVATGELYFIELTLGETTSELIAILDKSWQVDNDGNILLDRNLYESYRQNRAGEVKLIKVDGNGQPLAGDENVFSFYEVIPIINGELMQFGADTQKNFPLTLNVAYHIFDPGESIAKFGAYAYIGDNTILDVPALSWPPIPQSAEATGLDGTDLDVTFDRDVEFPTGAYVANGIEIVVNGVINPVAANVTILSAVVNIDIGGGAENITITPGDTVTVNFLADTIRGASDNRLLPFVTSFPVLNSTT